MKKRNTKRNTQRKTTEEFIIDAKKVHKDKYDYSKVVYVNSKAPVIIFCKKHKVYFEQRPNGHLRGADCVLCGNQKISDSKRKDFTKFATDAISIHGKTYDYSKVVYINDRLKTEIICKLHGSFYQTPNAHLAGNGCPVCGKLLGAKKRTLSTQEFVAKAKTVHNDKYNYSMVEYAKSHQKVVIICRQHGEFKQTPNSHLSGSKCPECVKEILSINYKWTTEEFIKKANLVHDYKYDYSESEYLGSYKTITIICPTHNKFKQTAVTHLCGHGCPRCAKVISRGETDWLTFMGVSKEQRQIRLRINGKILKIDGFSPETNTIYEFYGDFWHGNPKIFSSQDINPVNHKLYGELYSQTKRREELIKQAGFGLIYIWEHEWNKNEWSQKN